MLTKKRIAKSRQHRVTFLLPQSEARTVHLLGDFTDWQARPMRRFRDGTWRITVDLVPGREFRFRYLLDGARWENDPAADRYDPNPYGSDDSVVVT
ncbi:MAG TPA: isoamylase early set domain-containing protein [Thermoanaerobaculaceae bacterium]|nr:isoamylase early set domain-containing protein [Thermoanaerobaculaceae bacterium]